MCNMHDEYELDDLAVNQMLGKAIERYSSSAKAVIPTEKFALIGRANELCDMVFEGLEYSFDYFPSVCPASDASIIIKILEGFDISADNDYLFYDLLELFDYYSISVSHDYYVVIDATIKNCYQILR